MASSRPPLSAVFRGSDARRGVLTAGMSLWQSRVRAATMGICDLRDEASRQAGTIGGRRYPVLAVTAPKNDPREAALGNFLLTALGLGARGRWSERKYLLFELLVQYGVECLIIDDAHDLSMPHLIFLKELTDQLQLSFPSQTPLGLCLVAAGRGAAIPLKDVFDQPETMWMQFWRRQRCNGRIFRARGMSPPSIWKLPPKHSRFAKTRSISLMRAVGTRTPMIGRRGHLRSPIRNEVEH